MFFLQLLSFLIPYVKTEAYIFSFQRKYTKVYIKQEVKKGKEDEKQNTFDSCVQRALFALRGRATPAPP